MLDENKEKVSRGGGGGGKQQSDLLMKPFALGWTREVVNRVITKNRNLNCDIYYYSPAGKKIRSLTEIKSNLTDGLTPECFSFKRQPLGINESFEKVRDARVKKKGVEYCNGIVKPVRSVKPAVDSNKNVNDIKDKRVSKHENDIRGNKNADSNVEKKSLAKEKDKSENQSMERSKRVKKFESKTKENDKPGRIKEKMTKTSARKKTAKRKDVLAKVMAAKQAKQIKVNASKKILNNVIKKKVSKSDKHKLSRAKPDKETGLKNNKLINKINSLSKKTKVQVKHPQMKPKKEDAKEEAENSEGDKKSAARDLRSIVKKNIGKYREMREKQKLAIKSQVKVKNTKSKAILVKTVPRPRSEPISKNKQLYLKPLEKGWRRELVFRTNCARAGQHADVYYFHPSGKKLRSCREIAENLTHDLTIEYFTFRKEPIGCGEPSEVIRNARSHNKPV